MAMGPSGKTIAPVNQQQLQPPQPFEIALVRKLESKTTSVRNAFLLLDADGDGRISPEDLRAVLHNELGLDITTEQENSVFARSQQHHNKENKKAIGMGYAECTKYFAAVSSISYPTSQSGLAAAAGFHRNANDNPTRASSEIAIHLSPKIVLRQRRHQLRQLFTAHSSREGEHSNTGSGLKDTSLFLAMDVHRSGKVTMKELLNWLNTIGSLEWSMEELKQVVLGDKDENEGNDIERERLEFRWFGGENDDNVEREAGMAEHEFAVFVESLDVE